MATTLFRSLLSFFILIIASQVICISGLGGNEKGKDARIIDGSSENRLLDGTSKGYPDLEIVPDNPAIQKRDRFFDPMDLHSAHMGMEPSFGPFDHGHHDHHFPNMGMEPTMTPFDMGFHHGHHNPHHFPDMGFATPEPSFGFADSFPINRLCSDSERHNELASIRSDIERTINENPELAARYVRIAFHDCFTKSVKANSGCNGSIRFRQESGDQVSGPYAHLSHSKLGEGVQKIVDIVRNRCMTVADGVLYAMAIAIKKAGGPDVVEEMVNVHHPRLDALEPDVLEGELPGEHNSFNDLLSIYKRKGLTKRDLIASSMGGHSMGGVRENGHHDFTTDPLVFSTSFACNLVQRMTSMQDLQGFHTLQSDTCLLVDSESLEMLRVYAGCTDATQECTCGGPSTPERENGLQQLKDDYGEFLLKLALMNDP